MSGDPDRRPKGGGKGKKEEATKGDRRTGTQNAGSRHRKRPPFGLLACLLACARMFPDSGVGHTGFAMVPSPVLLMTGHSPGFMFLLGVGEKKRFLQSGRRKLGEREQGRLLQISPGPNDKSDDFNSISGLCKFIIHYFYRKNKESGLIVFK